MPKRYPPFDPEKETAKSINAAADLAYRAGAKTFALYATPISHSGRDTWSAEAVWSPKRQIKVTGLGTCVDAATSMAVRILLGAVCRCGYPATFIEGEPCRCAWRMYRGKWRPSCPPVRRRRDLVVVGMRR